MSKQEEYEDTYYESEWKKVKNYAEFIKEAIGEVKECDT